jgi:hypothetical protein
MISNLRSKPIEGHITDSAGNVLRNAQVIIKQEVPTGSFVADSIKSDDDGYFISKPMPNGVYDIYESGIRISRIIHQAVGSGIPCFKADQENFDITSIGSFTDLAESDTPALNDYRAFIQIEPSSSDISQFGNMFPIYDRDISMNPSVDDDNELLSLAEFFNFSVNSRITTTRFDIEYYSPITSSSSIYKKIRWAGVPGIKFYRDSRVIIPLDYYSIVPTMPKLSVIFDEDTVSVSNDSTASLVIISEVNAGNLSGVIPNISVGDILKIQIDDSVTQKFWYGIVSKIISDGSVYQIELEKWKSSRFISEATPETNNQYVRKIYAYDGLFSSIMAISEEVNQRFCVTENNYAQDNGAELYNYSNA